ncbi:MAG: response regulator transcription factor [Vicinamibacterales bacterium]
MKNRLLLVEDDKALAHVLSEDLRHSGYEVDSVAHGDYVLERLEAFRPDLVLLDVVLPGKSGFELCALIRRKSHTPVIMVTARDTKTDKLTGLDNGADDYVTKPFDFDEFLARIRAVLRRTHPSISRLILGSLTIDFSRLEVSGGPAGLHLTPREFSILSYLSERSGSVVHRSELLREVWGYPQEPRTRAVDFAIKRLREKIEPNPHMPRFIHSVRGDGYRLTVDATAPQPEPLD